MFLIISTATITIIVVIVIAITITITTIIAIVVVVAGYPLTIPWPVSPTLHVGAHQWIAVQFAQAVHQSIFGGPQ